MLDRKPRIAIVGDIMTDVDLHCSCERLCQEGPWPVMKVEKREERPGGAANVRVMCESLGAETLLLGLDPSIKTRFFVDGCLIGPRMDDDYTETPSSDLLEAWHQMLRDFKPNALIVADHGKGVVYERTADVIDAIRCPVFVDPVPASPRMNSATAVIGSRREMPAWASWTADFIIEKQAKNGIAFRPKDQERSRIQSTCRTCIDPLGAGDQFIATLAISRVRGDSWTGAIHFANYAAGLQCERRGCVPVTWDEIAERMNDA